MWVGAARLRIILIGRLGRRLDPDFETPHSTERWNACPSPSLSPWQSMQMTWPRMRFQLRRITKRAALKTAWNGLGWNMAMRQQRPAIRAA
jgi:hypothetical protein